MQAVIEEKKAEIVQRMDEYDEEQILAEIKGQVVEPYFYSYKEFDREVHALSYTGVRYIATSMAEHGELLILDHSEVVETPTSFRGKAVVRNAATGMIFVGVSEQEKNFASGKRNPFAYVLAYNKAERNAFRKHEPEKVILAGYEAWKDKPNAVRNVTPPKEDPSKDVTPSRGSQEKAPEKIPKGVPIASGLEGKLS